MTGFADTVRGDGLARIHRALDGLKADPLGLDRARTRFSQPPPSYTSIPSGTTTRSVSPKPPSDELRRREQREERFQRRRKLIDERAASLPLQQFEAQKDEEMRWIWDTNPHTNWMSKIPVGGTEEKEAIKTVRKRWIEQGIWKNKWDEMAAGRYLNIGRWKHEEPLELESESEDIEAESRPPNFSVFSVRQKNPQPKPKWLESSDDKRRVAERRAVREREREASRPYFQFIYQISKERERIQDKSASGEGANAADINTRAYENIKNTWTKRGIWDGRWGILPGMSWRHEWPLEEEAADDLAPVQANPLINGSHEGEEAPPRRIFGFLSPLASNHRQAPDIMNMSQQGRSADVSSDRLQNGDAERSPSISNSPRPRTDKQSHRSTTGQALRPSRKSPSHKDGRPQPVASASLGPVHSSRVSKVTRKKGPRPQRWPSASQEASSSDLLLPSGPDIAEPVPQTASIPPRRSKRLQPLEHSTAKGPTAITSTQSLKSLARSRPKRNLVAVASAKPEGISKRRRSSTIQGKARKG